VTAQFHALLKPILLAAWRRRKLLLLPVLFTLPLSLLWWQLGPRTYVATSLMLLQEGGSSNPLIRDVPVVPSGRIQERIAGLQALLKSDRVLGNVYRDLHNDPSRANIDFAAWRAGFSRSLSVELIGTDFLEFQLKDSNPQGMGKKLESVTSRFLEALLPDQNSTYASQVLLERRKEDLENAQRKLLMFRQRTSERFPQGLGASHNRLAEARASLKQSEDDLKRIVQEISERRARLPGASPSTSRVEQEIAQVRAEMAKLHASEGTAQVQLAQAQSRLSDLLAIRELDQRRGAIEADIRDQSQRMEGLVRAVRQTEPIAEQLAQLERQSAEAKEALDEYARRYQRATSSRNPSGILNAPERIKLIDAPRDPEMPTASALRTAILALLSSIALGIGLTLLAELLDQRLRSPDELADATGLPVLARLS
jgi:uncharacterized protein involved in exopolysaccharide biosynthesis